MDGGNEGMAGSVAVRDTPNATLIMAVRGTAGFGHRLTRTVGFAQRFLGLEDS